MNPSSSDYHRQLKRASATAAVGDRSNRTRFATPQEKLTMLRLAASINGPKSSLSTRV
jgi:hypothetical protein